jgi:hypothetical protein
MEEEFKFLENIGNEVTITIPEKDLVFFKIMYASIPHRREGFGQFLLLAAKHGLSPIMWEAPNWTQAQIYLAMQGEDPFVSPEELIKKSGMPTESKPPKIVLRDWKSPMVWHIDWTVPSWGWSWYGITPRWKKP